jgi:translation initiation factor IF-2
MEVATGSAKILRVFSKNKDKQVAGGRIEEGEIKSGSTVKIYRRESQIGEGKIKELQAQKVKTDIVKEKQEFGMMLESKIELSEGDIIKATSLIKQE